ncbi:MAG: AAA family ATPase [Candidatus Omnitrophica bacterium]|nr:AAA family ATPase [Candidatus Omnitrophota bacterium]
MPKIKFVTWLKMNWLKLFLIFLGISFCAVVTIMLVAGFNSYVSLESFSRKQMVAQMGMYLFMGIVQGVIMTAMYGVMYYYVFMGGGMAKFLGSNSAIHAEANVKWDDVIGMENAKKEAWEIVQFLKDRKLLKIIGGNIIKGTLLVGSPGCGKTYLAKAIATEAGLPFLSAVGSEFVGVFVGLGASRMKSLFKEARQMAKAEGGCIIFIDEIDSFARPRIGGDSGSSIGAQSDHNATINQFLTELDGLRQTENNIVVIAATNVPEEDLDSAIMRSGRFDRKIEINKPTAHDREDLLRFYLKKITSDPAIDIIGTADRMKWFSPADINNMVREAAIISMRANRTAASQADIDVAIQRVIKSIEKTSSSSPSSGGSCGTKMLSSSVNVKWDDIIGMESAKREAREIVGLLKDRQRIAAIGGKIVKGILLMGPPGCGKTYIAKAFATEAGIPMISMTGSEFFAGVYHGTGPKRVMQLFKEARLLARSEGGCIIFIDEMDSFAHPRGMETGGGAISEENNTINQFLAEVDGLHQDENNIVLLGATNATEDMLDPAILRSGRFERKIYVTRPNLKERKLLFDFYLKKVKTLDDVNSGMLARKTLWFSPADIDNMVREAGMLALRDNRDIISFKDLSQAYDRILYGEKSNTILNESEKEWVSYHEAGHAIIAYLLHPTNDVIKATIIPHKGSLGFVAPRPKEEVNIRSKEWYLAEIKVSIASYAAERIKFGTTGSGVSGDFQSAVSTARQMVWNWGMGRSGFLGDLTMNTGSRYQPLSQISERTKEKLDDDVQELLQSCLKEAEDILTSNRPLLDAFAAELKAKGELEYDEIQAIFDRFNVKPQTRPPLLDEDVRPA